MPEKNENETAYLEYFKIIQNTITRMAQNSFLIKAWSVTLIAGLSILTFSFINFIIFIVLIGFILIFWILDSYYLRLERLYRKLYEKKVEQYNDVNLKEKIILFDLNYDDFVKKVKKIPWIMFSQSEILFYMTLIIILGIFLYMA